MNAWKPIEGKVALVTGASRGIGFAIAAVWRAWVRKSRCARAIPSGSKKLRLD